MSPRAMEAKRRRLLLESLETRLEALTGGLQGAVVTDKGIDLVKEMKELHALLEALQPQKRAQSTDGARVIVVWGDEAQDKEVPLAPCGEGGRPSSSAPAPAVRTRQKRVTRKKADTGTSGAASPLSVASEQAAMPAKQ